jgi:DNA-binding beta-propeller fold protein YncE
LCESTILIVSRRRFEMKARLFVMFALCVSLVLVPTWTVSAQGPKPTPTPVRGKVLPPSPEPTSQPKGYNPQVELSPASDWDAAKPFARAAMSFAGTSAAPRSPRALGQPGFSLRYVQTLGFVGEAYTSDTTHINYPYGIGSDGTNVWIAESLGDRALKFASDGTFLMQIGQAGYRDGVSTSISMDWLSDVAVDGSGNIWVVEQGADQVYKFNSSGVYQRALGQMWTSGIGPNQFNNPCGVAFDGSGNVYVSDGDNHRVQIFTNTGTSAFATIGTGVAGSANNQFRNPRQIAIDSGNRLYVADSGNNRVQIWDVSNPASASYIATIGTGVAGSGNDQLRSPAGVAVDASKIYVADSSNHRVQIFDRTTRAYQGTIGTGVVGSGNDQFNFPTDVAVVGNLVYVADNGNSRVQQIVTSGPPSVRTFGTTGVPYVTDGSHYNQPSGIAIAGDGSMYVTEARGQRLLKLNSAGTMQWTIGEAGVGSGVDNNHLNYPNGVALDSSGRAYVADSSNQRVQIFDSTGAYVATMGVTGSTGTGNDRFNDPQGVATDTANNIYVADRGNHRVQIFDSSRAYVATLGVAGVGGTDNAHLNSPVDVFVDSAGNIYVADRDNHRVQIFNSSRAYVRTIGITGSSGSDFEHLSSPVAVAVDTAGRTYVADQWGGRVQVFDSTGAYLATVGNSGGKQTGQMRSTGGLAFDNAGNLWIAGR